MKYALGLGTGIAIFVSFVGGIVGGICMGSIVLAQYPEAAVDFANDCFGGHLAYRRDVVDNKTEN